MFGILFAMPQYFQEVRGLDSFATGLRMLPMIGGMVIGMVAGTACRRRRRGRTASPRAVPPSAPGSWSRRASW